MISVSSGLCSTGFANTVIAGAQRAERRLAHPATARQRLRSDRPLQAKARPLPSRRLTVLTDQATAPKTGPHEDLASEGAVLALTVNLGDFPYMHPLRVIFFAAKTAFLAMPLMPALSAAELILTNPNYGKINANALDQPRLYTLVSDPLQAGAFKTWYNPVNEAVEPVLLTVFVDTGASGVALSYLSATGELDQANLDLGSLDYLGEFTEIGIGGPELGNVSRELGVWMRNGAIGASAEIFPEEFDYFGDFRFWVRREVGAAEVVDFLGFQLVSPLNLVGMPVIRQRRLHLDPTGMAELSPLITKLLPNGAIEPVTHVSVPLILRDFIGDTPPPGEVTPSHYANPLVPGLTLRQGATSAVGEWLLDTGAGSSFSSFAMAQKAGLIPAHYADIEAFMAEYTGPTVEIGGIGASRVVPRLIVDQIRVPTREGVWLVWENVELMIIDVAGLDGIFGMNLLVPSVTVDPADPFGSLFDVSPGPFSAIVIDATDALDPNMRLAVPAAVGGVWGWLGETFTATERSQVAVGSLTGDADGDAVPNLLEYALGLDPREPNSPADLPHGEVITAGGQTYLALRYTRPTGDLPDLTYAVEISHDLIEWRREVGQGEIFLHDSVLGPGEERETLTYRTTAPSLPAAGSGNAERFFLRLAVDVRP